MNESRKLFLVCKLLNGTIADKELMEFFEILKKFSVGYMLYLKSRGYKIGEKDERLQDLAHGFMASLFRRDDSGNYVVWHRYVEQQGKPNEVCIDSFLKKIANRKTKQELSKYYQSKDWIGSNIHRMVTKFGGEHYTPINNRQGKVLVHVQDVGKPVVPLEYEEAAKLFEKYGTEHGKSKTVAFMLNSIPVNGHARSVRVSDVIAIIRNRLPGSNGKVILVDKEKNTFDVDGGEDHSDEFLLRDKAFKFIDSYCQNPDNNTPWARFDYWPYAPVLKDVIDTYLAGTKDSLYDCFKKYFPNVSNKEYRKTHRFRTEYLFKMVMKHLRRHVKQIR